MNNIHIMKKVQNQMQCDDDVVDVSSLTWSRSFLSISMYPSVIIAQHSHSFHDSFSLSLSLSLHRFATLNSNRRGDTKSLFFSSSSLPSTKLFSGFLSFRQTKKNILMLLELFHSRPEWSVRSSSCDKFFQADNNHF